MGEDDFDQLKNLPVCGNTPLVFWGRLGSATIWIKREGSNPSGSLKDRHVTGILKALNRDNALGNREKVLLDTSSGSYGIALALYGAAIGFRVKIITRETIEATYKSLFRNLGAELVLHGRTNKDGYDFCRQIYDGDRENYIFTDQLNNPYAAPEHENTAREILEDLGGQVAAIFGSMGSGATVFGMRRHFLKTGKHVPVYAVTQAQSTKGSFVGTWKEGYVDTSFVRELRRDTDHKEVQVKFDESIENWRTHLLQLGYLVGKQTAAVLTAAMKAIRSEGLTGNVVIVSGNDACWNI